MIHVSSAPAEFSVPACTQQENYRFSSRNSKSPPFLQLAANPDSNEMESARKVQNAALSFRSPVIDGLDIAIRSRPLGEVSGDFCLVLPSPVSGDDRVGLVLGDVSGKGVPAALLSTSVAHLLPWLHPLDSAATALGSLNRDLWERSPADTFVTLVLAKVSPQNGNVRLWTVGHTPPLHWIAREGRVQEAECQNSVLGVRPDWEGMAEEWVLETDDVLLICSDGLTETRNGQGELFGSERVARILERYSHLGADEIADTLLAECFDWGTPHDDLSLLVCKRIVPTGNTVPGTASGIA